MYFSSKDVVAVDLPISWQTRVSLILPISISFAAVTGVLLCVLCCLKLMLDVFLKR